MNQVNQAVLPRKLLPQTLPYRKISNGEHLKSQRKGNGYSGQSKLGGLNKE
jgi:hypothetical protein